MRKESACSAKGRYKYPNSVDNLVDDIGDEIS